jgi:hypothetical protein
MISLFRMPLGIILMNVVKIKALPSKTADLTTGRSKPLISSGKN